MNEKIKKVLFEISDTEYARFRIKLKHDKLKQKEFFCFLVRKYLESDKNMLLIVDSLQDKVSKIGKSRRSQQKAEIEKGSGLLSDLNLSKKEREEIYDIIENEFGEEVF